MTCTIRSTQVDAAERDRHLLEKLEYNTEGTVNEDDVVRIVRSDIEGLFPRDSPNCGRHCASLREYLRSTTHLANPILYDDITDDIPADPFGPMSLANSLCGTTLTVSAKGIRRTRWWIRDRIDREVLQS